MPTNKNLIAISGAPGAGKTTLLDILQSRGYACVPEVARRIIQEQMQSGGNALPWQDTTAYIHLMLESSIASYLQHQHAQHPTFFDRGLPDTLGYAQIIKLPDQRAIEEACDLHRYAKVFLAPPWRAIYTTDTERKQTFEEALFSFEQAMKAYTHCGYDPILLPLTTPNDRADFVQSHLDLR
ncbi:AAA family ATPase [Tunturiibacter gelidoferens]|jgi:predicted ATPase|uniref:ATPase n=1 Tax=Tunturiibacter gelidiferens TaxID=3069689 RepID=A0A9X0QCZ4_9BACT|nr:AAA family ATPase [Edaphobacter lichenicola]MBB5328091.1 putative ATPase [Edaphobacter lichenicola]